jgi:cytochrome c peroxidase
MSLPAPPRVTQARLVRSGAGVSPAFFVSFSLALLAFGASGLPAADLPLKDQPHLRRPVAAAWIEPGKLLAVANQRSGSVSIVDMAKRKVLDEFVVGERLADVAALSSARWFVAVDEKRHELLVLRWGASDVEVIERIPVSPYPVNIAVSPDGSRVTVASVWSRTITTFGVDPAKGFGQSTITKLNELTLSFAPRGQIFLPDGGHVVVADAFGGNLAMIDVPRQRATEIPEGDIFGIYGMALNFDRGGLYVAHHYLRNRPLSYSVVPKQSDDPPPKWIVSGVRAFSFEGLRNGELKNLPPKAGASFTPEVFHDFTQIAPSLFAVLGQSPPQLLPPADGQPRVLVNRFADNLTVFDAKKLKKEATIKLGPTGTPSPADRGEALFYDARLSADGSTSCHTCHTDGHTTGQLADTLGDGTKGTPKRILTLLGTRLTDRWAWSGEVRELNEQVRKSLETTMHQKHTTVQQVNDITAFLHTLSPPPPLEPATEDPADKAQLARGEALFQRLGCVNCHVPPLTYTSPDAYDVGLRDEKGMSKFNPPSLRGVSQGYSFFHDGRAKKLEEVFTVHGHQLDRALADGELADLLRFLRSL